MREKQSLEQSAMEALRGTTIFDIEITEAFRDILRAAQRFESLMGHEAIKLYDFQPQQVARALRALHSEKGMAFITKQVIEADHPDHIIRKIDAPDGALWCVARMFKSTSGEVDGSGSDVTACFPATISDTEILSHFPTYSHGPGRGFAHKPHLKRSKTRVLVTQHTGLDI